jgi:hypothetical protein
VEVMAAPQGNQFWKARTKHGRDKLFASADGLWEACCEYFEWVEANPLWESKLFSYQGEITEGIAPKMRAMTIDGMTLFLDVDYETWRRWREDEDFRAVVTRAEQVIRDQKFSGAAADLLNANIIARDLGLADKKDLQSTDGTMSPKPASVDAALVEALVKKLTD